MSLIYMRAEDVASVDEEGRTLFLTTARPGEGWRPLSASITEEYLHAYARAQAEAARRIWVSMTEAPCLGGAQLGVDELPRRGQSSLGADVSTPRQFKEPGSGLVMTRGCWYILSDSGSSFTPLGFIVPWIARGWWRWYGAREWCYGPGDLVQPSWNAALCSWEPQGWDGLANLVKADHLWAFWRANDADWLTEAQHQWRAEREAREWGVSPSELRD